MITIKGIKDTGDRSRVALAIVSALGSLGVCTMDPEVTKDANCAGWAGSDRCRYCAAGNYIKFED